MPAPHTYDYAVIRVVPRVERGEFVNVGVIVSCSTDGHLEARIELDEQALLALDPAIDLASVRASLESITRICQGGAASGAFARMTPRERFHWLVAPRSTAIQTSTVHSGRCDDLHDVIDHLMNKMVRRSKRSG
ncbi:DUF3037 domain-containing protein [soil metagenome]